MRDQRPQRLCQLCCVCAHWQEEVCTSSQTHVHSHPLHLEGGEGGDLVLPLSLPRGGTGMAALSNYCFY